MWISFSVSPPAADWTSEIFEIELTVELGKDSCDVDMNESREKWLPALPRFWSPSRVLPFSFCNSLRSFAERRGNPGPPVAEPEFDVEIEIGRVTDMSVPTPVSGLSTFAWAWSRPVVRAVTVTTRPTPTARPSAVSSVLPLRRRSSQTM